MISLFLSVCLSVCAPFRPYNSKTVKPIQKPAQIWWAGILWGTDGFFQIWCNLFEK